MRNMSFAITTEQCRAYLKIVTRRTGWKDLQPDTTLRQVEKGMGLKKGEKVVPIHEILVRHVRREPLRHMLDLPEYGLLEVAREGFPDMHPAEFVTMFCDTHKGITPESFITRIHFRYWMNRNMGIEIPSRVYTCHTCGGQRTIYPKTFVPFGVYSIMDRYLILCPQCQGDFFNTATEEKKVEAWVLNTFVFRHKESV